MRERILYIVFVFFLILYAPYWLYLPVAFIGIIIFPFFWEAIVLSLFIDFYYGPHTHAGTLFAFPFAITAALLVLAAIPLKERLRYHL